MRYTETELDKIIRIGCCRIDQIIDRACDELEDIKPKPVECISIDNLLTARPSGLLALARSLSDGSGFQGMGNCSGLFGFGSQAAQGQLMNGSQFNQW